MKKILHRAILYDILLYARSNRGIIRNGYENILRVQQVAHLTEEPCVESDVEEKESA